MNNYNALLAGLGTSVGVLVAYNLWQRQASRAAPLPPCPPYYPLIGNLLSIPTKDDHLVFHELGKKLNSDIFSLHMFGTLIIVLNSPEDAINLLEKRSSIYSDRFCPPMVVHPSLMNWPGFISMLGYNDRWRKSRRLIHPWLHKKAAEKFHPSQHHQVRLLLKRLLESADRLSTSEELEKEFYQATATTLAYSVYGYNLQSFDDPIIINMKEAMDNGTTAALPSNFLVNLFPALIYVPEWFPGASWKRKARKWREQQENAVNASYNWAKTRIEEGISEPCIVASLLDQAEHLGLELHQVDDYVKQAAVTLFLAGTDTTTNALLVFVLAMLLFPETQRKAQEEIDAVVGTSRLPTMEDKPQLQYVGRLIREVLRWRPTLPGSLPHACYQDDVYKGYRIPKGAIVIGNVWAISRDPELYKDAESFNPDRFIDPDVPPAPVFGFGRRSCPGIHYADASLYLTVSAILATFNISLAKDTTGNNIVPVAEGKNNVVYHPKPFKFKLTPRSNPHAKIIRAGN